MREAVALAALSSGCGSLLEPHGDRERTLAQLARDVAVPDMRAILLHSENLESALRQSTPQPSAAALETFRAAFRKAALAWQNAYAFRNGPVIESHAFLRSAFWPIRPAIIRELLESDERIDAKLIAELGVDAKGVFAIEHLLFEGPEPSGPTWYEGPMHERARALGAALADEALSYAQRAATALADGSAFAERFAQGGQQNISLLVNQMISTLETAGARRLDYVLGTHDNATLRTKDVQGAASGLSTEIPRVWLATTERIYMGAGLSSLVVQAAPKIDAHVRDGFASVRAAMARLRAPLERVAETQHAALASAVQAVKALESALRIELVSALGVTLSFVATDGD